MECKTQISDKKNHDFIYPVHCFIKKFPEGIHKWRYTVYAIQLVQNKLLGLYLTPVSSGKFLLDMNVPKPLCAIN